MSVPISLKESLDVEFRPHAFFPCGPEDSPFTEPIGTRGWLVTFASHFRDTGAWDPGLALDVETLSRWELGVCAYGATDPPVLPFLCELRSGHRPLTGSDILAGLNARLFRSEHIPTLQATRIAYPGYHPHSENDEIHNDFAEQYIFENERAGEVDGVHGDLKRSVEEGKVWYVLLHPRRQEVGNFVFLVAVGRSLRGGRLMGVVTHQFCHNLCD